MSVGIGLDVGGTKTAGGVVDLVTGAVLLRREEPTAAEGLAQLAQALGMARGLLQEARAGGHEPRTLGLGVAELVSPEGRVFSGHRIRWNGLPVRERLSDVLPAVVEADVRAAALAEARFGAGQGLRHFLYVTVGTGISAVSVQGGVPYAGARGAALVIANGLMRHTCPACGHEDAQILEEVAGGAALARAYGTDRAEAVIEAAERGDARAQALVDHAARELGQALGLLAGALDPEAVVLGGGLGSAPGRYADRVRGAFGTSLWDGDARDLPLLRAAQGADAGIIGAAIAGAEAGTDRARRTG